MLNKKGVFLLFGLVGLIASIVLILLSQAYTCPQNGRCSGHYTESIITMTDIEFDIHTHTMKLLAKDVLATSLYDANPEQYNVPFNLAKGRYILENHTDRYYPQLSTILSNYETKFNEDLQQSLTRHISRVQPSSYYTHKIIPPENTDFAIGFNGSLLSVAAIHPWQLEITRGRTLNFEGTVVGTYQRTPYFEIPLNDFQKQQLYPYQQISEQFSTGIGCLYWQLSQPNSIETFNERLTLCKQLTDLAITIEQLTDRSITIFMDDKDMFGSYRQLSCNLPAPIQGEEYISSALKQVQEQKQSIAFESNAFFISPNPLESFPEFGIHKLHLKFAKSHTTEPTWFYSPDGVAWLPITSLSSAVVQTLSTIQIGILAGLQLYPHDYDQGLMHINQYLSQNLIRTNAPGTHHVWIDTTATKIGRSGNFQELRQAVSNAEFAENLGQYNTLKEQSNNIKQSYINDARSPIACIIPTADNIEPKDYSMISSHMFIDLFNELTSITLPADPIERLEAVDTTHYQEYVIVKPITQRVYEIHTYLNLQQHQWLEIPNHRHELYTIIALHGAENINWDWDNSGTFSYFEALHALSHVKHQQSAWPSGLLQS